MGREISVRKGNIKYKERLRAEDTKKKVVYPDRVKIITPDSIAWGLSLLYRSLSKKMPK